MAGCGVDRNIEDRVTIHEGVYGLLVTNELPIVGTEVMVYAAGDQGVFAKATSDHDGVYQIDLPTGDYTLCTEACTPIATPTSATVRYDWTSGPGGGSWQKI
jgi:hypothetical protein